MKYIITQSKRTGEGETMTKPNDKTAEIRDDLIMNLIEGLQEEIERVNEIIKEYEDPILNGGGMFAATMMKNSIKQAENAIAQIDTVAMLSAIKDLKEYEL